MLPKARGERTGEPRTDETADAGRAEGEAVLPGREAELAEHEDGDERRGRQIRPLTRMVLKNSARSAGCAKMQRHPSIRSAARSRRASLRTGCGSALPIARMARADSKKLTASATTVVTGPNSPIAAPPSGGPSAVAVQVVDSNRPLAAIRSAGGTRAFRNAPLAALKAMSAAPTMHDTTRSWAKLSQPSANAAGTLSNAANRIRSIAIITGRLRRNSTHGPSGTASAAPTANPAAASTDTSAGPACSTMIAIRGNASNPSQVPNVLIA